jgi:isocitrate lyase
VYEEMLAEGDMTGYDRNNLMDEQYDGDLNCVIVQMINQNPKQMDQEKLDFPSLNYLTTYHTTALHMK